MTSMRCGSGACRLTAMGYCCKRVLTCCIVTGRQNGRVLVLHLHPWLIGQPFRIGSLDDALGDMMRHQGVWAASGAEIVEWYSGHQPAG